MKFFTTQITYIVCKSQESSRSVKKRVLYLKQRSQQERILLNITRKF